MPTRKRQFYARCNLLYIPYYCILMGSKTIFMNIPIYNNFHESYGHLIYIFAYIGEAIGTIFGSTLHFLFGYKLTFCYCSFVIATFYFVTLTSKPVLLLLSSFILGFFFGTLWLTTFRLLSFSASHPDATRFSVFFQLSNFLHVNILPLLFSHSLGPNNITDRLLGNDGNFTKFYQLILAKESYEILLICLIITLLGSTLIVFQPKLWKIVGIKVQILSNIYRLTLVDYIENRKELQKVVKVLYQQNRRNHLKRWLKDIIKSSLTKSHRYKFIYSSIGIILLTFYVIYVEWKSPRIDNPRYYLSKSLNTFGRAEETAENVARIIVIIFLSFLYGTLEYHIYCYYQLIAREFGLKAMLIPRITQFLFNAIAMVLFLEIPIILWLLITMFLTFISAVIFFHAEKYTIRGVCITKGINPASTIL
uniref:Transporter n=1 Tax=Strongyloides papillosus TaxID=174720 RepID=A0A0N5B6R2_STREA